MIYTSYDIQQMDQRYRTTLINSVSGFKSLQMVGTGSPDGITNLALFNSIFHVGANPPLLGMVCRPQGENNSTLDNIQNTGHYTLNNVLPQWYERSHQTSARYPLDDSEFTECGFTKKYLDHFKAPFVAESTIKIGLELREIIPVTLNNTTIVIGEILYLILNEELVGPDGFTDLAKAGSTTVAGLDSYYTVEPLGRLDYAKPGKYPEHLSV